MMRIVMTLLGVGLLAGGSAQASTLKNGLFGKVTRGPITPVCSAEKPCSEPAAGAVLVFTRRGHESGRVHVRKDGSYRIPLAAGVYTVRVASRRPLAPGTVTVRQARFRHVDFSIDTGIR
jgi:hypothetical protein